MVGRRRALEVVSSCTAGANDQVGGKKEGRKSERSITRARFVAQVRSRGTAGQKDRRSAGHVGMTYSLCSVCPWMGATL